MLLDQLSHTTYAQFYLVSTLLILFILGTICAFYSIKYSQSKKIYLLIWGAYIGLLSSSILIEIAPTFSTLSIYISIFKLITLSIIIILFIHLKKGIIYFNILSIILFLSIFILSFTFHYLPIYLLLPTLTFLWLSLRPTKLDIIIEKEAPEILNSLEEGVLILSTKGKILFINSIMNKITKLNDGVIYNNSIQEVVDISGQSYLINRNVVSNKGIIVTASDITERVSIQKKLEESICELNRITDRLEKYSINSDSLVIKKEKSKIYRYVEILIRDGSKELSKHLHDISNTPPQNYDTILTKSRNLLNEIREIVSNWSAITGVKE